jgi:hypothetical protein
MGDVGDARIGGKAPELARRRVHRCDASRKSAGDQVVEDLRPDPAALAVGADDRHAARFEEGLHRRRRGSPRPRRGPGFEDRRDGEGEHHAGNAALDHTGHGEARVAKHVQHPPVRAEHVGIERPDAFRAGQAGQVLEQPGADPMSLQRVGDRERDLRAVAVLRIAIEPGEGHNPSPRLGDHRCAGAFVQEGLDPRDGEHRYSEEAEVEAFVGERRQEATHGIAVVERRPPHADRRPVPHHDIGSRDFVEHGRLAAARTPSRARISRCDSESDRDSIRAARPRASGSRRTASAPG